MALQRVPRPEKKRAVKAQKLPAKAKAPAKAETPLPFREAVMKVVLAIPRGQVRSYAQVALYAGRPGAARGVGQEMARLDAFPRPVPWWRVTRSGGTLAPTVAHEQAKRLRDEGVLVEQRGEVFRVKVKDPTPR